MTEPQFTQRIYYYDDAVTQCCFAAENRTPVLNSGTPHDVATT